MRTIVELNFVVAGWFTDFELEFFDDSRPVNHVGERRIPLRERERGGAAIDWPPGSGRAERLNYLTVDVDLDVHASKAMPIIFETLH